jgi:alpha-mannosidase
VDVQSDTALFEIQYGMVRRRTHRNTSEDMAKFEVAGHRWADLSEADYGVALLNNCKYGYKVLGNEISLSLLRAPSVPDPKADRGKHTFTYSFLPHTGAFSVEKVHQPAVMMNQEALVFPGCKNDKFEIPYRIQEPEIIIETIKRAEKEDAKIIRLYNNSEKRIKTTMPVEAAAKEIFVTDLMENSLNKLEFKTGNIELSFKGFEIKTLKVYIDKNQK